MKYLESEYYSGRWYFGSQSYATIKNWFKLKDRAYSGIKHVTRRHRRSFISCRLPKVIGNRVIYRLFKTTRWFKEPNVKYGRKGAE